MTDGLGRIIAFTLTPGQPGAARAALSLLGPLPAAERCLADGGYDSDGLRQFLLDRGTVPVIPNPTRKRHHSFDQTACCARNLIQRAFCRLKDWQRIATRYDKLAANLASAVAIAATLIW